MSRVSEGILTCQCEPEHMIDGTIGRDMAGWLIAYGWLWPTKASFLHSRNLFVIQIAMVMIATLAALLKCPIEGQVRNVDFIHS